MNILYIAHFIIPISILMLPLLPIEILKYVYFYPIIFPIIWLIFKGCPWTKVHSKKDRDLFIYPILKKIYKKITIDQTRQIVTICLMGSMLVSSYLIISSKSKITLPQN